MLVRVLLFLLLCSVAKAESRSQGDDGRTRVPERRSASDSIPHFDHSPGEQPSVPAGNSIPDNSAAPARR